MTASAIAAAALPADLASDELCPDGEAALLEAMLSQSKAQVDEPRAVTDAGCHEQPAFIEVPMTAFLRLVPADPIACAVDAVTTLHTDLLSVLAGRSLQVACTQDQNRAGPGDRVRAAVDQLLPGFPVELVPVHLPCDAVLRGDADIAAVDLQAAAQSLLELHHTIDVAAVLPRPDVRYQACTAYRGVQLSHLSSGAAVGVSTTLGVAQISQWRPDLRVQDLAGDPEGWFGRVHARELDAIVVDHRHHVTAPARLYPSPLATSEPSITGLRAVPETHSGLVGVLCRDGTSKQTERGLDEVLARLVEHLRDFAAYAAYAVEQACLTRLRDGGVRIGDVAVYAEIEYGSVSVVAVVAPSTASGVVHTVCQSGPVQLARRIGTTVADALRDDLRH